MRGWFRRWHATIVFFDDLERCVLRMLRRRLALGFQTWVSVAGLATKRARAIHRVLRSKKRSIKHMQHRRLGRALRVLGRRALPFWAELRELAPHVWRARGRRAALVVVATRLAAARRVRSVQICASAEESACQI